MMYLAMPVEPSRPLNRPLGHAYRLMQTFTDYWPQWAPCLYMHARPLQKGHARADNPSCNSHSNCCMSNWLQSILLHKHPCQQLAFLLWQMVLHSIQAPMMGACRVQVLLCSLSLSAIIASIHIFIVATARALGCDIQRSRRLRSSMFSNHTASLIDSDRQQNTYLRAFM